MQAYEVLERAADSIDRRGWWRDDGSWDGGGELGPDAPTCAALSIFHAVQSHEVAWLAVDALAMALEGECGYVIDPLGAIYLWNDAPERTKDEVTSMMRAVAASLRAAATSPAPLIQHDADVDVGVAA